MMKDIAQHRATTLARRGLVVAPHYLAAEAGLDMIKAGGSAADAAIAANAVLQVVYPFVCGLGGDLFAMVYDAATGSIAGLNASGRSAAAATVERYGDLGFASMPVFGIHTVTVPGCPSGWQMLSDRFGRLGLARALAPAISYAQDGFAVGPDLASAIARFGASDIPHPSWRAHFMPDGAAPAVGSIMRFPTLARTLQAIGRDGATTFYRGEVAAQMADFFARIGGLITAEDLAAHQGDWVTPLAARFAGLEVYELPPNTQGVTALQMLGIVDGLPLGPSPLDPQTAHIGIEAKKLAFADRQQYLADPAFMRASPATLISPSYLERRRALIDPTRARADVAPGSFTGDTIYLCAADGDGNAVSLIQSNYMGFGSGVVVDDTGIVLHNRGALFTLDPARVNALAPRKRPLHTLIPSLALRDGRLAVVFGAMGGDGQPQTHLQVYSALARFGMNIQAAIEMPRWVHGARPDSGEVVARFEDRWPAETLANLAARGHAVVTVPPYDPLMGYAQGITFDPATGVMAGGADPRAESAAAGW
jgi:gamma-glutamyltranspeptidase